MALVVGIVAVDKNNAIGKAGAVPWRFAADLRFFKRQTLGHACVMGHRTWLSLKKPLTSRLNIVMSRSVQIEPQANVIVLRDKISVLTLKDYLARDLFIIGGEQIYRAFEREIDKWIVTEIPVAVETADTFMPPDFLQGFEPCEHLQLEENLRAIIYERAAHRT